MSDENVVTLSAAAQEFGFSVSTLRREAARGRLVTYKIGRRLYTKRRDVLDMIERCRVPQRNLSADAPKYDVPSMSEADQILALRAALLHEPLDETKKG